MLPCCYITSYYLRSIAEVFSEEMDAALKDVCLEIAKRYQIHFLEIGTDKDHVHFLIQSVPTYTITKLVTIIKSITARELFKQHPTLRKTMWGSELWTDGYFVSTVGEHGNDWHVCTQASPVQPCTGITN